MELYLKRSMESANDCNLEVVEFSYVPDKIKKNGISITMVE